MPPDRRDGPALILTGAEEGARAPAAEDRQQSAAGRPRWRLGPGGAAWVGVAPYAVPTVLTGLDLAFSVRLTQLLVVGPCLAAISARARGVAVNVVFALLLMTYLAVANHTWGTMQQGFTTLGGLAVGAVCVLVAGRRERAQRTAAVVEERRTVLADVVESSHEAITGCLLDGTITIWNPAAERLYGYPADDAVGRTIVMLYPGDAVPDLRLLRHRITAGESVDQRETTRLHRDGTILDVFATVSPMRNAAGVVIGATTVARDLRPLKEAERARAALKQQVHQLRRVESLSKLAGGIAHDFNNLLAVITSSAEFIDDEAEDPTAVRSDVAQIRTAADRAAQLTRQLLQFARGEHRPARTVDLNTLIGAVSQPPGNARENVELVVAPSTVPALVHADPGRLEQALFHLIANACDAMPDGGTVTVGTEVTPPGTDSGRAGPEHRAGSSTGSRIASTRESADRGDPRDSEGDGRSWGRFTTGDVNVGEAPADRSGRRVLLSVTDTGAGMTPEVAERVFEPFFSTKGHGNGAGLGLASVYGIVTDAGGHIDVRTAPGRGTTFTLDFPLDDRPSALPAPSGDAPAAGAGHRILVVDDQQPIRDLVGRILRRAGYDVAIAESADIGLQLGIEQPVDLLLTDLVMPGTSGRCLASSLVQRRPDLPVLFMTGYNDSVLDVGGADSAADILTKPFTERQLLDRVRAALDTGRDAGTSRGGPLVA